MYISDSSPGILQAEDEWPELQYTVTKFFWCLVSNVLFMLNRTTHSSKTLLCLVRFNENNTLVGKIVAPKHCSKVKNIMCVTRIENNNSNQWILTGRDLVTKSSMCSAVLRFRILGSSCKK